MCIDDVRVNSMKTQPEGKERCVKETGIVFSKVFGRILHILQLIV